MIVGRIKDEPEVRVVCHTKSSLAPEGKAIAFRLDKNNGFEWIGEYDISADELLNGEGKGQKTRKAKEFLLEILADGGMAQKKIEEEAENWELKENTEKCQNGTGNRFCKTWKSVVLDAVRVEKEDGKMTIT